MVGKHIKVPGIKFLALIIVLSTCAMRCENEINPVFEDFIFVLPFSIDPSDSVITKGDTLWLTTSIPDTLYEFNSGKYYKFERQFFAFTIIIKKLLGKQFYYTEQPGAIPSFGFTNYLGYAHEFSQSFGTITLEHQDNYVKCLIAIIPNTTGVYAFSLLAPAELDISTINLGKTSDGRLRKPVYRGIYFVINDGESNFDLYKQHCKAVSLDIPSSSNIYFEQKGTFTFRVIE